MPERHPTPGHEAPASRYVERRAYVRLSSTLAATCRPPGRSLEPGWLGTVRDISRGGVGLLLRHCFQPGTDLAVELRDVTGQLLRTVGVRVIHATAVRVEGSHRWLLGCSFDQPLSDAEFQALQ
jgi:c-di-GMP-binding flagellar brake protein YcgR